MIENPFSEFKINNSTFKIVFNRLSPLRLSATAGEEFFYHEIHEKV